MKMMTLIIGGAVAAGAAIFNFVMPEVELKVRVIDEQKMPVKGALAGGSFPHIYGAGAAYEGETREEKTDQNGIAVVKAKTAAEASYGARKEGYYTTANLKIDFMQMQREGKPLKAEREVMLKQIIHPIPMYAHAFRIKVPVVDTALGYDLMEGDWVPPYGKGKTAEIIFKLSGHFKDYTDNACVLDITFPNKGDGLVPFRASKFAGSELRSAHQAPVDGYLGKWSLNRGRKPGQMSKDWINDSQTDRNYYIRVRTMLDEKGDVISALYGKIYGDFEFLIWDTASTIKAESYYLNPIPNDRNIEFDPKRNLSGNVNRGEQVTAP